jgi:AcrR family transcriptional regulator
MWNLGPRFGKPEEHGSPTIAVAPCILAGMLARRTSPRRNGAPSRDPERTRELLLQATFREMYRSGYQSADLDAILASTGVTKGSLYCHFDNKETLGSAVVDEIIASNLHQERVRP